MPHDDCVSVKVALSEIRSFHNISLEFLLQLPSGLKHLISSLGNVKVIEDQGIYYSKTKILE